MNLEIQLIRNPNVISSANVIGALRVGMHDLKELIHKARSALSNEAFEPTVAGFQIVANGGQIVFIERRGVSPVDGPLPDALRLSRWSLWSAYRVRGKGDRLIPGACG